MPSKESHEVQGTLKECIRELAAAIGHRDFELKGDTITVQENGKRFAIHLVYEGDRKLGSLDLPMTRVDYEFDGYTDDERKKFMDHIAHHLQREGG